MKIVKPSFRIKKANEVCFSSDSKYIYSIGSRLNTFSVEDRKEIYSKKHIKHEDNLSISQNNKLLCIKNTNGELVTCLAGNGELISQTGRIKHYNEGEEIYFSQCDKFLIDMSWSGAIQVYDRESLKLNFSISPPADYMIAHSAYNSSDKSYIIYYSAREGEKSLSFITILTEKDIISNNVNWSTQKNKLLQKIFCFTNWSNQKPLLFNKKSSLSSMALSPKGDKLAIVYIKKFKMHESIHSLAIIDLDSGEFENELELFPYMTQIAGLSWSHDSRHIFISTEFMPEDKGLSFYERYDKYHPHDTCKINIIHTGSLQMVKSISFPEAKSVVFSPDNQFLAIASSVKGLVLHRDHVNQYFGLKIFTRSSS